MDRLICNIEVDEFDPCTVKIYIPQASPLIIDEEEIPALIPLKDNSVYTFELKDIKDIDGMILPKEKITFTTAVTPAFIEAKDVLGLAEGLELPEHLIWYHIKEASKSAMFYANKYNNDNKGYGEDIVLDKDTIQERYYPFYVYIKYKAFRDCLLTFYTKKAAEPNRIKNQTGDLVYEEEFDLDRIKALLDKIEKEYEDILEEIITITANPKATMLGKRNLYKTGYRSTNMYNPTGLSGFRRGY